MNPVRAPKFSLSSCLLFVSHRTERMEKKVLSRNTRQNRPSCDHTEELHDEKSTTRNGARRDFTPFNDFFYHCLLLATTENQSARPAERDTKREKGSLFT